MLSAFDVKDSALRLFNSEPGDKNSAVTGEHFHYPWILKRIERHDKLPL
jgi:hypothetical protein